MSALGKSRKRKQPAKSRTCRVLSLDECRLISTELLLGNSSKRMAFRMRDHCIFWFVTMTGLYDPVQDRIKNDVCIGGEHLKGSGHTIVKAAARKKRCLEAKAAKAAKEGKDAPAAAPVDGKDEKKDDSPFAALPPELRGYMEKALADEKAKTAAAQKAAAEAEAKQRALEDQLVVRTPKEQELEVKLAAAQAVIAAAEEAKKAGSKKKRAPKARTVVLRPELREMLLRLCSGRPATDFVYRSGVIDNKPISDKAFMKILKDAARTVFKTQADLLGLRGEERKEYIESRIQVGTTSCRKVFVQQIKEFFGGDGMKADQCLHTKLTVAQHYQRLTSDEIKEAILGCNFDAPVEVPKVESDSE